VTIHHCIASGDLSKMRELRAEAEKQLAEHGDLRAALEVLKVEIAKAEAKGG
jgi:Cdc6-like AAA superfamily ATPase